MVGNKKKIPLQGFSQGLLESAYEAGYGQKINAKDIAKCIGRDRKTVYMYLNGDSVPDATALGKMCKLFHVSADYILFG